MKLCKDRLAAVLLCVLLTMSFSLAGDASAAVLGYEGWDYGLGSDVDPTTLNGGVGFSGSWDRTGTGPQLNIVAPLDFSDYDNNFGNGNAAEFTEDGNQRNYFRPIDVSYSGADGDFWSSFLYNFDSSSSSFGNRNSYLRFGPTSSDDVLQNFNSMPLRNPSGDTNVRVSVDGSSQGTGAFSILNDDTNYWFVSKFEDTNADNGIDQGSMWVLSASDYDAAKAAHGGDATLITEADLDANNQIKVVDTSGAGSISEAFDTLQLSIRRTGFKIDELKYARTLTDFFDQNPTADPGGTDPIKLWTGPGGTGGSGEWTTASYWNTGQTPGVNDTARFDEDSIPSNSTITVANPVSINALEILNDGGQDVTFTGAQISLNSITVNNSSGENVTINNDIALKSDGAFMAVDSNSNSVDFNGEISGAFALKITNSSGGKNRRIDFNTNNSWSGGSEVSGAIGVGADAALGTGDVTLIDDTGISAQNGSRTLANNFDLGTSKLELFGNIDLTGDISGDGSLNIDGNTTLSGVISHTGQTIVNAGGRTLTLATDLPTANIVLGDGNGNGDSTLTGVGAILFNIDDPANPGSSLNDLIETDWGRDQPSSDPGSPGSWDYSVVNGQNLTLKFDILGVLDTAEQYVLMTADASIDPDTNIEHYSAIIQNPFLTMNVPTNWVLDYNIDDNGFATSGDVIVLRFEGAPVVPEPMTALLGVLGLGGLALRRRR